MLAYLVAATLSFVAFGMSAYLGWALSEIERLKREARERKAPVVSYAFPDGVTPASLAASASASAHSEA